MMFYSLCKCSLKKLNTFPDSAKQHLGKACCIMNELLLTEFVAGEQPAAQDDSVTNTARAKTTIWGGSQTYIRQSDGFSLTHSHTESLSQEITITAPKLGPCFFFLSNRRLGRGIKRHYWCRQWISKQLELIYNEEKHKVK